MTNLFFLIAKYIGVKWIIEKKKFVNLVLVISC